ncbi:TonB-dependent receptor [Thiomicrospira sp.]|uniref:TonB-dependent receptor n=1 Tax=Thiomicrospira sp. TaxID=935 RepID=UPI002F924807
MKLKPLPLALFALIPGLVLAENNLSTITVNADLRETSETDIAASVDVMDEAELQDRGATHFGDVLLQTPNVNFSGQSSRPRHIQIRGMGERDEYTGAPNASVGFAVDEIDFSGIGMVGNLFDVKQVEVLRGPQSTRYGASALAGLVNIETNDPTPYNESLIEASVGTDNLKELGVMTSGAFSSKDKSPQYRVSLFKHNSDGFRDNDTLNRTDTNKKDELTARAKLRWWAGDDTQFDLSLMHADINNGYDVFTRDNSFTTLSNEPGEDTQKTNAGALKVQWDGAQSYRLTSTTTYAQSDMVYGYDEDWLATTTESYLNQKERQNLSQELRWISNQPIFNRSTDWLFGLYATRLDETNRTDYYGVSTSEYQLNKLATFAQFDYHLSPQTTLITGARVEQVASDFSHSNGDDFSPNETLWGGQITLNHDLTDQHSVYAGISKGYKAGGFNTGLPAGSSDQYLKFDSETAINYEVGHKMQLANLNTKTSLFYIDRTNAQFDGYSYDPVGGSNWVFFTENFDSAQNYGLETEVDWQATSMVNIFANLGLIQTEVEGTPLNSEYAIDGREQAHAPNYQYLIGAQYRHDQGWFGRVEVQGMDTFYFDNVHDQKSEAYTLANARIGYEAPNWEIYLWGKNLTDEKYATRGYYFDPDYGNNPDLFIALGDPRQIGLTTRVRF